jgi:hypothetical protein
MPLDENVIAQNLKGLPDDVLTKLGITQVTMGASADTKVAIKQYESAGVWASMNITFDFSAFTGELPVNRIINEIVLPVRNSFTKFAHPETMSRVEELRAIIEGIRDGKSDAEIERRVQEVRGAFMNIFTNTFEVTK